MSERPFLTVTGSAFRPWAASNPSPFARFLSAPQFPLGSNCGPPPSGGCEPAASGKTALVLNGSPRATPEGGGPHFSPAKFEAGGADKKRATAPPILPNRHWLSRGRLSFLRKMSGPERASIFRGLCNLNGCKKAGKPLACFNSVFVFTV